MNEKDFFEHAWDSAHPLLAHFPIALLTFAFLFALAGYAGSFNARFTKIGIVKKMNLERFYRHVWVLQLIGTIFIYPTMLFGERDFDTLGSEALESLAKDHERFGELTTNYYLATTFFLGVAILHYRHSKGLLDKNSKVEAIMNKRDDKLKNISFVRKINDLESRLFGKKHPVESLVWLILSAIGFVLLAYTGYLGGELVHQHGIRAN